MNSLRGLLYVYLYRGIKGDTERKMRVREKRNECGHLENYKSIKADDVDDDLTIERTGVRVESRQHIYGLPGTNSSSEHKPQWGRKPNIYRYILCVRVCFRI